MARNANRDAEAYALVEQSFLNGIVRLSSARFGLIVSLQLLPDHVEKVSKRFTAVELKLYEAVVSASLLVYATSLFDVFLSDTTRFLFNLNIGALGKSCQVPIEVLASPKAAAIMVNREIERKTRALSYKSFIERIEYLQQTFALNLQIASGAVRQLIHLADLRNKIVHDQSPYSFEFDERQKRAIRKRPIPGISSPLTDDDLSAAQRTYLVVAIQIVDAVKKDILKLKDTKSANDHLESYLSQTAHLGWT